MPDEKQPPAPDTNEKQDAPVETEESGAGYGNNAGVQGDAD